MQLDWRAGDITWVKMKGFSEWPAVVAEVPNEMDAKIKVKYFFSGDAPFFFAKRDDLIVHTSELMDRMKKKTANVKSGNNARLGKAIVELEDHMKKHGEPRVVEEIFASKSTKKDKSASKSPKSGSKKKPSTSRVSKTKKSAGDSSSEESGEPAAKITKTKRKSKKPINGVDSDEEDVVETPKPQSSIVKKRGSSSGEQGGSPSKKANFAEDVGRRVSFAEIKEKIYSGKKIGILGFGKVGKIIAKNLLLAGHDVTVWNRTREPLVYNADHYKVAFTVNVLLRDCDVILCTVREGVAVDVVVNLLLQAIEKGPKEVGFVMLSAISIEKSIQVGGKFRDAGCTYLEAQAAMEGDPKSMNLLCAGSEQLYRDYKSTLASFTVSTEYVGTELGRAIKIVSCLSSFYFTSLMAFKEQLRFLEEGEFPDMLTFLKYMKEPLSTIARKVEQSNIQNYSETPTKLGLCVMRGNDLLGIIEKMGTSNELMRYAMARSPDKEDSVYLQQDVMEAMVSADRLKFQPIKNEI